MSRGIRALVCGVVGSALLLACAPSAAPTKPSEAPVLAARDGARGEYGRGQRRAGQRR